MGRTPRPMRMGYEPSPTKQCLLSLSMILASLELMKDLVIVFHYWDGCLSISPVLSNSFLTSHKVRVDERADQSAT